ncbi:MAG: glycine cleavage system protein GcvH [Acidobacteriota bacterium]
MIDPDNLKYTRDHEWIALEGEVGTIGITDFAQKELGDIVFVELMQAGTVVTAGKEMGTVESVKAVSEVYSPVNGTLEEINGALSSKPELINQDPYGRGWMVRVRLSDPAQVARLMDQSSYEAYLKQEASGQ